MKKIIGLSVIASIAISTSVYADTLQEAFANSKVSGEIKAQYFDKQSPVDGKNDTISVVGGNLNLKTGSYYGFGAGVTFQTSHVLDVDYAGTNDYLGFMDASGSVMSESYLTYTYDKTMLKVGRQYMASPLVASSGSRMLKDSFEAYTLTNTNIPNTTLMASYITKYQNRTDGDGNPGKFVNVEDGAYTIYAKNTSIENLTLQAQYLDVNGETSNADSDALYFDAAYNWNGILFAAQYLKGDVESNANSNGRLLGFKVSGNIGPVNLTGLYTTTNDKDVYGGVAGGVVGLGNGADSSFTALPLHGGAVTYAANTDTAVAVAATNIMGVTAVGYYGVVKSDDDNNAGGSDKITAYGGFLEYAFTKNFSAKVMYESADFKGDMNALDYDSNRFRLYTSYKF